MMDATVEHLNTFIVYSKRHLANLSIFSLTFAVVFRF